MKLDKELVDAAMDGDTEKVKALLDQGADIHAIVDRGDALSWAAGLGNPETMALLIERGADIRADTCRALCWAGDGDPKGAALLLTHYTYKELKILEKDERMKNSLEAIRAEIAKRKEVMRETLTPSPSPEI
jgi:hypothetical protein